MDELLHHTTGHVDRHREADADIATGRWLTAAAKRLHHNVLATALVNKLAHIAWTILVQKRYYETYVVTEA